MRSWLNHYFAMFGFGVAYSSEAISIEWITTVDWDIASACCEYQSITIA